MQRIQSLLATPTRKEVLKAAVETPKKKDKTRSKSGDGAPHGQPELQNLLGESAEGSSSSLPSEWSSWDGEEEADGSLANPYGIDFNQPSPMKKRKVETPSVNSKMPG